MITDGMIILIKDNKETEYELCGTKELRENDLVAQLDDDTMTVYKVTETIRDNATRPDTIHLESVGYSKEFEHHIWIEL